jgi:transcriptional regulator of acetoin/glycerol metabolism
MFNDKNAGIVIAEHGVDGHSKFKHIIDEHDRLRRVKYAQEKMLEEEERRKKEAKPMEEFFEPRKTHTKTFKWVAMADGYQRVETTQGASPDKKKNRNPYFKD